MGVWLMPYPETFMPLWLRVWKEDDLGPVMDTLRELRLDRTIEGVPSIYNTLVLASVMTRRSDWYEEPGPMPEEVIDRVARELDIGRWIMRFALYGDEAVVDHNYRKLKAAFERIEGADVSGEKCAPEDAPGLAHPGDRVGAGVPSLDWNNMTGWYGGDEGGHIGFSPVAPLTSEEGLKVHRLLRGLVEQQAGLDYAEHQRAQLREHRDGHLRHEGRGAGSPLLRHREPARPGGGQRGLRRVPGAPELHGSRLGAVLVRRPFVPPLLRDDQGRRRPERDHLPRPARNLAGGAAPGAKRRLEGAVDDEGA
jgi:hypothetical protein